MRKDTLWIPLGPPFGGKGKFMEICARVLHAGFIGVGDACREEAKHNTAAYQAAVKHMRESRSTLWPTKVIRDLVRSRFERVPADVEHVFVDGYLRLPDQVEETVSLATDFGFKAIGILHVMTSDQSCYEREEGRKRDDDQPLAQRLDEYHKFTTPAMHQLLSLAVGHNYFRIPICGENMRENAGRYAEGLHHLFGVPLSRGLVP